MMKSMFSSAIFFICCMTGNAQLRLPAFISSGMVVQQNDSVEFWGWADASATVKVKCSWSDRTDSTVATNGARWALKVKSPAAGGPFTVRISADTTIELKDVWSGEVWFCSGQSNMQWSYINDEKDIRSELSSPANAGIRLLQVPHSTSDYPQDDLPASWTVCDSNRLKTFSAVGYFFARKLQDSLKVPIGLIGDNWGGTPAEIWTPAGKIDADTMLSAAAAQLKVFPWWPSKPGVVYNAMVYPLIRYRIAGAIWYQGEANTAHAASYTKLLTTMIDSWREAWKKDLPFYYVQIAPYKYTDSLEGARLQEAQTKVQAHPNTGMVVVNDLIDSVTNIHPSHKREVGNRLANWALAKTYGKTGLIVNHPQFDSGSVKGPKMSMKFTHAPTGLMSKGKKVTGFYLSDSTGNWYPATVVLQRDQIVVSSKEVKHPVYVRYGFSNVVVGNVFSKEGLPLIPFRTDDF